VHPDLIFQVLVPSGVHTGVHRIVKLSVNILVRYWTIKQ
jgi:hypothetical protein